MADLGFLPVVRRLLEATPPEGQRMLFSATLDNAVDVLVRRFLTEPGAALRRLGRRRPPQIGPSRAHRRARGPGGRCRRAGGRRQPVAGLHPYQARRAQARPAADRGRECPPPNCTATCRRAPATRNLASFASGAVRVMVATDIAARGIHVDGIDLVIHADPPAEHKAYLHRSGRTARAGAAGVVITLQTPAQGSEVRRLMRRAGVVPLAVAAGPDSPVLRSIAGPPAERVMPSARHRGQAQGEALAAVSATGPGAAAVSRISGGNRGRRWR